MSQLLDILKLNFPHMLGIIAYGVIGLLLSIIGYLCFKSIIPFKVDKGLTEKENIAVGIIIAGIVIGVSIIVAAASYEPGPVVITVPSSGCGTTGKGCLTLPGQKNKAVPGKKVR